MDVDVNELEAMRCGRMGNNMILENIQGERIWHVNELESIRFESQENVRINAAEIEQVIIEPNAKTKKCSGNKEK